MAGNGPGRSGSSGAGTGFWGQRWRDLENLGEAAAATGREAYDDATQASENLIRRSPGGILGYGGGLLGGTPQAGSGTRPTTRIVRGPAAIQARPYGRPTTASSARTNSRQDGSWLDRSDAAKATAGALARAAGVVPGAARGAWHTAKDAFQGVEFLSRLANPFDALVAPPGEGAWDQAADMVRDVVGDASNAISNPKTVVDTASDAIHRLDVSVNPGATPQAKTFGGEVARNFNIGQNQGEFAFDVGSLLSGIGEAKGLSLLGKLPEEGAAKYLARGVSPQLSEYFAKPYTGMGHHTLARRTKLPLLGGPVPSAVSDNPFFLLKPGGMSNGDFYELHYSVDPFYHGGRVPREFGGGGWSGKSLGWEKHGPLARTWFGSTPPQKVAAGAGLLTVGAGADQISDGGR